LLIAHGLHHERFGDRFVLPAASKAIIGRREPNFGSAGIADTRISSKHVEVMLDGEELEVEDLDSKNGVLFNERRLGEVRLLDGQAMQIGSTFLVYRKDAPHERQEGGLLIGSSRAINRLRDHLAQLAPKTVAVSIAGPVGSEKELAAAELHRLSGRAGEFVVLDLSALPSTRHEAELFGDEGSWAAARGGTLYIDDLPRLPLTMQTELLRRLESPAEGDPRVVAAFGPEYGEMASQGIFDPALHGHLSLAQAVVPPLRERPEDIGVLVRYCLNRSSYGRLSISPRLMWALLRNPWPGELRALERLLTNQAMSAPRGVESLDLNPSTHAALEQQRRMYSPGSQDDATVDLKSTG
jgi:DNA-binding NtrC family response regulator